MEYPVVRAKDRAFVGTGIARKVRELGFIPAVVYGGEGENRAIVVDPKVVTAILNSDGGKNRIVSLNVEGEKAEKTLAVVREFQLHPLKRNVLHCDFMRVHEKTELLVKVGVVVVGKSEAEKLGAVLKIAMRQITMKCPASLIPEHITIDASKLNLGDSLKISQLPLPQGARAVFLRDNNVVIVSMPKLEKPEAGEEVPAAGAPAAAAAAPAAPAAK